MAQIQDSFHAQGKALPRKIRMLQLPIAGISPEQIVVTLVALRYLFLHILAKDPHGAVTGSAKSLREVHAQIETPDDITAEVSGSQKCFFRTVIRASKYSRYQKMLVWTYRYAFDLK